MYIYIYTYIYLKNFAWLDQRENVCYICHVALERVWSAIIQYSMVRYEKCIINNETIARWHIQVNSAKISLYSLKHLHRISSRIILPKMKRLMDRVYILKRVSFN